MLIIVGGALATERSTAVPELVRAGRSVAKLYVYVFALAPAVLATLIAALRHQNDPLGGEAAPVVLSGLAVIVLAGNVIRLYRQMVVGWTWFALLIGPPVLAVVTILVLPWTVAIDLKVNEPAAAMGRFFTESFNRRTNKPLEIVVGDARLGGLVAMASPQRPRLLIDGSYERAPWVTEADIRQKGAIVVWWLTDAAGTPPAHLRERFPDLVPEVPRTFERAVQGRIGWAMIRPESAAPSAAPPQAAPAQ